MDEPETLIEIPNEDQSTLPAAAISGPPSEPTPPRTVAVVGINMNKARTVKVVIKCDQVVPKRYHVTVSGGRNTGGRQGVADKSFAVHAESFEAVYDALPGLLRASSR